MSWPLKVVEEAKQKEHHAALKRKVGDGVSEQGLP